LQPAEDEILLDGPPSSNLTDEFSEDDETPSISTNSNSTTSKNSTANSSGNST